MLRYRYVLQLALALSLAVAPALAQSSGKAQRINALNGPSSTHQASADCELGLASTDLDVGGVRARLYNTGGLFWRGGDPLYEVPKGSGVQAIFAAGLWIGAVVESELRFAGADYGDWEYWPGPLDENGEPPADCSVFDRFWTVRVQADGSLVGDVDTWPVELGAGFEDANGDGEYNPVDGDLPTVVGDQTTFWVMNDKGGVHQWSGAQPLSVEVRVTTFAFDSQDAAFGQGTFYRYEIVNKSPDTYEGLRVGFWNDADVGDFNDDYVGSDSTRGLSFTYNADNLDEGSYETRPPALGVDVLSGAAGFMFYTNDNSETGNPIDGREAYDYMGFTWTDGTPVSEEGGGYNPGASLPPTAWFYPGEPETSKFWSERNRTKDREASVPGDRRGIAVASPVTIPPGESAVVDIAILFALAANHMQSVRLLRQHSDQVQAAYDSGALFPPLVVADEADELALGPDLLHVEAYPNPARGNATVSVAVGTTGPVRVAVYDILGREVAILLDANRQTGTYQLRLDTNSLARGLYFVQAVTPTQRAVQKLTIGL